MSLRYGDCLWMYRQDASGESSSDAIKERRVWVLIVCVVLVDLRLRIILMVLKCETSVRVR